MSGRRDGCGGVAEHHESAALAALARRPVNYVEADAPRAGQHGGWHVDEPRTLLGLEPPGPPVAGGVWETACELVRAYEFADPRIVRAVFRWDQELLGRDMLLKGRFLCLRLHMGVRVTEVLDTDRDGERIWGWAYQTLQGHLEQGRLAFEVVKELATGRVELRLRAYSRHAPVANPLLRLGFRIFGRFIQLRSYAQAGRRLHDSVRAHQRGGPARLPQFLPGSLVTAPSRATESALERFSVIVRHPGT